MWGEIVIITEQIKERVIDLYINSRMTVFQISKKIMPNGELSYDDVISILDMYQKENGKKIVRKSFTTFKTTFKENKGISNDEIEKLVNEGYSAEKIAKYFTDKGFKISRQAIYDRKKKIFNEKGMPIPSLREEKKQYRVSRLREEEDKKRLRDEEINNKIFYLREEKKMSFWDIVSELAKDDIHIGVNNVKKRCLKMYNNANKELHYFKTGPRKKHNIDPEKLVNLREQGCTCYEIAEFFGVTPAYIIDMWGKAYKEKEMEPPVNNDNNGIPTEKIVELKKLGLSYDEIIEFFKSENINISESFITERLKNYYKNTGENVSKIRKKDVFNNPNNKIDFKYIDKKNLKNIMFYLKNTRNATDEQIYQLYKCYGIEPEDIIEAQVVDERDFDDR